LSAAGAKRQRWRRTLAAVCGMGARGETRRFSRYLAVGALATAVHYLLLVAAVELAAVPAWLASGLGAVVGAQVAYLGNRQLTFAHRGPAIVSWPRFQITALVGAALGMGVVAGAVHWRLHYLVGQVLATGLSVMLTYAINRYWTFAATRNPG